jgi:hypothetical protein
LEGVQLKFEIGDEVKEFMAQTGLREDAVRYAARRPASEQTEVYEDEDVEILFAHDPDNRRLRLVFNRDRSKLLQVRPVK